MNEKQVSSVRILVLALVALFSAGQRVLAQAPSEKIGAVEQPTAIGVPIGGKVLVDKIDRPMLTTPASLAGTYAQSRRLAWLGDTGQNSSDLKSASSPIRVQRNGWWRRNWWIVAASGVGAGFGVTRGMCLSRRTYPAPLAGTTGR